MFTVDTFLSCYPPKADSTFAGTGNQKFRTCIANAIARVEGASFETLITEIDKELHTRWNKTKSNNKKRTQYIAHLRKQAPPIDWDNHTVLTDASSQTLDPASMSENENSLVLLRTDSSPAFSAASNETSDSKTAGELIAAVDLSGRSPSPVSRTSSTNSRGAALTPVMHGNVDAAMGSATTANTTPLDLETKIEPSVLGKDGIKNLIRTQLQEHLAFVQTLLGGMPEQIKDAQRVIQRFELIIQYFDLSAADELFQNGIRELFDTYFNKPQNTSSATTTSASEVAMGVYTLKDDVQNTGPSVPDNASITYASDGLHFYEKINDATHQNSHFSSLFSLILMYMTVKIDDLTLNGHTLNLLPQGQVRVTSPLSQPSIYNSLWAALQSCNLSTTQSISLGNFGMARAWVGELLSHTQPIEPIAHLLQGALFACMQRTNACLHLLAAPGDVETLFSDKLTFSTPAHVFLELDCSQLPSLTRANIDFLLTEHMLSMYSHEVHDFRSITTQTQMLLKTILRSQVPTDEKPALIAQVVASSLQAITASELQPTQKRELIEEVVRRCLDIIPEAQSNNARKEIEISVKNRYVVRAIFASIHKNMNALPAIERLVLSQNLKDIYLDFHNRHPILMRQTASKSHYSSKQAKKGHADKTSKTDYKIREHLNDSMRASLKILCPSLPVKARSLPAKVIAHLSYLKQPETKTKDQILDDLRTHMHAHNGERSNKTITLNGQPFVELSPEEANGKSPLESSAFRKRLEAKLAQEGINVDKLSKITQMVGLPIFFDQLGTPDHHTTSITNFTDIRKDDNGELKITLTLTGKLCFVAKHKVEVSVPVKDSIFFQFQTIPDSNGLELISCNLGNGSLRAKLEYRGHVTPEELTVFRTATALQAIPFDRATPTDTEPLPDRAHGVEETKGDGSSEWPDWFVKLASYTHDQDEAPIKLNKCPFVTDPCALGNPYYMQLQAALKAAEIPQTALSQIWKLFYLLQPTPWQGYGVIPDLSINISKSKENNSQLHVACTYTGKAKRMCAGSSPIDLPGSVEMTFVISPNSNALTLISFENKEGLLEKLYRGAAALTVQDKANADKAVTPSQNELTTNTSAASPQDSPQPSRLTQACTAVKGALWTHRTTGQKVAIVAAAVPVCALTALGILYAAAPVIAATVTTAVTAAAMIGAIAVGLFIAKIAMACAAWAATHVMASAAIGASVALVTGTSICVKRCLDRRVPSNLNNTNNTTLVLS